MQPDLDVRPFETADEYAAMVDYFHGGDDTFLELMGIDRAKVPSREEWLRKALDDHARPDDEKERLYLAWRESGELVGHSSLSHIRPGESGHCHLHLWRPDRRRAGRGTAFMELSIDVYFERYRLQVLACEPHARNPAPNATLPRLGFRLVRRFWGVPNAICFRQQISRFELTRAEWLARRAEPGC